jgi:hypothetical protein
VIYPRVALVLVILPVLLVLIAVDALAFRPPQPQPTRLSGELRVARLADGTILISREDYEAGIYPIGRRFLPALP